MAIKKIEGFLYTCDRCGATHEQNGGTGHYTNSRPPGWLRLTVLGTALCRSGYDLCEKCKSDVIAVLGVQLEEDEI